MVSIAALLLRRRLGEGDLDRSLFIVASLRFYLPAFIVVVCRQKVAAICFTETTFIVAARDCNLFGAHSCQGICKMSPDTDAEYTAAYNTLSARHSQRRAMCASAAAFDTAVFWPKRAGKQDCNRAIHLGRTTRRRAAQCKHVRLECFAQMNYAHTVLRYIISPSCVPPDVVQYAFSTANDNCTTISYRLGRVGWKLRQESGQSRLF